MNSEEFVKRLQTVVYESVVRGTLTLLQKPPGRRPSAALVELSQWFNRLPPNDREHVERTVELAARNTVFEMLTVLDGLKSIWESQEEMGTLELRCNMGDESTLLNGPAGEFLHDIFAGLVPPE